VILLAHAGHWLVSLIYLVPVLAVVGWLAIMAVRERLQRRGE
jgi:hypothetical protein